MATPDINALLKADPRNCRYGAPMGDSDWIAEDWDHSQPLHLQQLRLVDGDYAADGTYWGFSDKIGYVYCAFDPTGEQVRVYTRAFSRGGALRALRARYPTLTFHKPSHTV